MQNRKFELVIFGSTGFTGQLAAEYVAANARPGTRWAIAGRNTQKLAEVFEKVKNLRCPPAKQFVVDHQNMAAVRDVVALTKVALSFAGPFARYGESVVAACADLGTHYLDITGETLWVSEMIDKYESQARRSGAILIPFSGFDSIPSDLGTWQALNLARNACPDKPVTKVVNVMSVKGGINGGTFETMLDILAFSHEQYKRFLDPALLVPKSQKTKFTYSENTKPRYVPELDITAPPFFMAPINSRVVYRSQALRNEGEPFEYQELWKMFKVMSAPLSWTFAASNLLFNKFGRSSLGLRALKRFGIKSGKGPSKDLQEHGFFRAQVFAYSNDELLAETEMYYNGDPGNKSTVLLCCESAFCFIESLNELPNQAGGFWTPSTALGDVLRRRITAAGVKF